MCDCDVKRTGLLGKPRSYGANLRSGEGVCCVILSFENDVTATSFFFAPHHSAEDVVKALRKAADEIEAKDSGEMPLSPKKDFFFHHS